MTTTTAPITIYGASDDLVEVEGAVRDEYDLGSEYSPNTTRLRLESPDGATLDVVLAFCVDDGITGGPRLDWTIALEARDAYPSWPIHLHERPNYEGDPAVTIDAPAGTTVSEIR